MNVIWVKTNSKSRKLFCDQQELNYTSFVTWHKEQKAKVKTETGFSQAIVHGGKKMFVQLNFLKFLCSRQKNQVCFDGYLSVVFELWIFIHYRMLIEFKLMTRIFIQQLWTKEFIRFLKFPCSWQKKPSVLRRIFIRCFWTVDIHPL